MTKKSHPEVQIFITQQKYNAGTFLIFSGLISLIMKLTEFQKLNLEFEISLAISSFITSILLIIGFRVRATAEKKLTKLYSQKQAYEK